MHVIKSGLFHSYMEENGKHVIIAQSEKFQITKKIRLVYVALGDRQKDSVVDGTKTSDLLFQSAIQSWGQGSLLV